MDPHANHVFTALDPRSGPRRERLERVVATTMAQNDGMCAVFTRLGFTLTIDPENDLVEAVLVL